MNETYYVGIENPTETRRQLLTSTKQIVNSLREYETFRQIRAQKLKTIMELKRVSDELIVLNKKLKTKLPSKTTESHAIPRTQTHTTRTVPIGTNKIEQLEKQLELLEQKIKYLD